MQYYSTNNKNKKVSLKKAVLKGLADDNGLYMPERIPVMLKSFYQNITNYSFQEIALEITKAFFSDDISYADLKKIVAEAINFDAPIKQIKPNMYVLELWHGPTCAFKDVGARFMARLLGYFSQKSDTETHVLVATSGDTGSAVANGFLNVPNVKVTILYPSGGVSKIQEQQLTTLGNNIQAIEIDGVFDDCQRLVKQAFLDEDLNNALTLTSANSINIARFLPQSFYYIYAYAQLADHSAPVSFSVPSGNFGNLTAGLFAKRMGLPVEQFVVSNNMNNTVYEYLESGEYTPRDTIATISNAMDVGDPSNFARMLDLYDNSAENMRKDLIGYFYDDKQTLSAIKEIYEETGYVMDPHGAVGYLGMKKYLEDKIGVNGIILETAHPAKFGDVVKEAIGVDVPIPERLAECIDKKKESVRLANNFDDLKNFLLTKR